MQLADPAGPDQGWTQMRVDEYVMPDWAVQYFGVAWMNRMREKARKGMGVKASAENSPGFASGGLATALRMAANEPSGMLHRGPDREPSGQGFEEMDEGEWNRPIQASTAERDENKENQGPVPLVRGLKDLGFKEGASRSQVVEAMRAKLGPQAMAPADENFRTWGIAEDDEVAQLGFDPSRHVAVPFDMRSDKTTLLGTYVKGLDRLASFASADPSTTAHEFRHRGIRLLRDAGVLARQLNPDEEERLVAFVDAVGLGGERKGEFTSLIKVMNSEAGKLMRKGAR